MAHLKDTIKRFIPKKLRDLYHRLYEKWEWRMIIRDSRAQHAVALKALKGKETIRCVFFALFESVWKYDGVYRLMEKSKRFEPVILVCPIVYYGDQNMRENMLRSYLSFKKKNYHVLCAFDEKANRYIDVRKELAPDIIFYTSPYKGIIDDRYYIDKFKDILTVYVPYFFNSNRDYSLSFNLPLHNLVWRRYVESDFHKQYAERFSRNKNNIVVSGFPGIDALIDPDYHPKDVWKHPRGSKKKIIWAPHHTIEPVGIIYYSCFLKYMDYMLALARKYADSIEIVFKPHPLLRNKLNKLWGKKRTDDYYSLWENGYNTSLEEGDYIDWFLTSDAMIHDSASFMVEYLYVNKPVMRTLNGEVLEQQFNEFGLECLNNHYFAHSENDIEAFVINTIQGIDPMKERRTDFLTKTLLPHGSPSEFIINNILDAIE